MGKNAFFQIVHKPNRTLLKVFPASKDGEMFPVDEVMKYLELINIKSYDTVRLNEFLKTGDYRTEFLLINKEVMPEDARCLISIRDMGECAVARFYPPSEGGKKLTRDDILYGLKSEGVIHGVREDVIDEFMRNPEYCRDYIVAAATPPVQGHDARIEYHFDLNTTAKPKLNEDGSVDFHQLGNIKPVQAGDKLATLIPADFGKPGINVTGAEIPQNKVAVKILKHGRNIKLSSDKCALYSEVSGHVTLVDDLVMVSDVYDVPANVDSSTGDIDFKGTVNVTGNVNTGYCVRADGDIVVNGVVEGATLIAGGNIVLKRGMQGGSRGTLEAEGNITAKFIENSSVKCGGTLMCDAVLHSVAECDGDVSILGRKGLINGGHISSYSNILATQVGSMMGTSTILEIMSDFEQAKLLNETEDKMLEIKETINKMDNVLKAIKKSMQSGKQLTPQQAQYVRAATTSKLKLSMEIKDLEQQCEALRKVLDMNSNVSIKVEGVVNPGVKVVIKDISRIINDKISACKFVREGADIKILGLY